MVITRLFFCTVSLAATGLLLCTGAAVASNAGSSAAAQARYRDDMAACNIDMSTQSRTTCRLEARNALASAKHGGLVSAPDQYEQNSLQRCNAHQGEDRRNCEARMHGEGSVEGSISSGGLLRKIETTTPNK